VTFWHVLIISYAIIPDSGVFTTKEFMYKDYQTCIKVSDRIYPLIYKDYPDSMATCVKTSVISNAPMPKLRPKNLGK